MHHCLLHHLELQSHELRPLRNAKAPLPVRLGKFQTHDVVPFDFLGRFPKNLEFFFGGF